MPIFLVSMLTDIIGKWKLSPLIQSRKELLLEKQQESWQVSNIMSQKISTTQKNPLASIWNRRSQAQELHESQGGHLAYVPNSTGSEHECRSKMPEEKKKAYMKNTGGYGFIKQNWIFHADFMTVLCGGTYASKCASLALFMIIIIYRPNNAQHNSWAVNPNLSG